MPSQREMSELRVFVKAEELPERSVERRTRQRLVEEGLGHFDVPGHSDPRVSVTCLCE